jgi:hypothetical protein
MFFKGLINREFSLTVIELINNCVYLSFKPLNNQFLALSAHQGHLHSAFLDCFFLSCFYTLLSSYCIIIKYFFNGSVSRWHTSSFIFGFLNYFVVWRDLTLFERVKAYTRSTIGGILLIMKPSSRIL